MVYSLLLEKRKITHSDLALCEILESSFTFTFCQKVKFTLRQNDKLFFYSNKSNPLQVTGVGKPREESQIFSKGENLQSRNKTYDL